MKMPNGSASIVSLIAVSAVCLGLAVSCSSVEINTAKAPNTDLTHYQTFAWVGPTALRSGNQPPAMSIQEQTVQTSVNQKLEQHGLKQVHDKQSADLLVCTQAYSKIVSDQSNYNSYGWDWGGLAPTPIREGILSVQLVDRKSNRVVWDGFATDAINTGLSTESPQQIHEVVNDLFKKYPNG
jgi:hypothetical protein